MPKLILAANRLPVTVEMKKSGEISFNPSVGGLATGMSSVSQTYPCVWVGFSGMTAEDIDRDESVRIESMLIGMHHSHAVPLTNRDIELYYNGFSNKTVWPLFHYFPFFTSFDEETWRAYASVNMKFYETIREVYEPGDMIWVHDYHLMLLPGIIRQNIPDAKIGFFLHIPFPSYEVFRLMPWRKEVLNGLLGSDLIGFHTFGYMRHFLSSVLRILGAEQSMGQLNIDNRVIKCDTFPMGIDYRRYSEYMGNKKITRGIGAFRKNLGEMKMILSMDRLDFTKGIIERLKSYELFLQKYPEFHGRVQMTIVTVPSRTEVDTYIKLRKRVYEQVGRINGKYNTLTWSPIQYLYRSLPFEMIMTLYHCADVCMVTPLRDGMNLVAKEYVAARVNNDGVLILSEMAGVSEELGEALIVNPHNSEEVADSIATALLMPDLEQRRRMLIMQRRLRRNDVFQWASSFTEKLTGMKNIEEEYAAKRVHGGVLKGLLDAYHAGKSRLLLFDYDGTLMPFHDMPDAAIPDAGLIGLLGNIASDAANDVAIISGRNIEFLERHFSALRMTLIAEHGAWIKIQGGEWKAVAAEDTGWKNDIRPIIESYCDRTPGTFIEEKEFSLAWHYRRSDSELAAMRAMELKGNLLQMIANRNLGIMEGNKVLEVKSLEINKGKIAGFLLSAKQYDFVIAIGDDNTDEDMFAALPEWGHSIKVGFGPSKAKYVADGIQTVRYILDQIGAA